MPPYGPKSVMPTYDPTVLSVTNGIKASLIRKIFIKIRFMRDDLFIDQRLNVDVNVHLQTIKQVRPEVWNSCIWTSLFCSCWFGFR